MSGAVPPARRMISAGSYRVCEIGQCTEIPAAVAIDFTSVSLETAYGSVSLSKQSLVMFQALNSCGSVSSGLPWITSSREPRALRLASRSERDSSKNFILLAPTRSGLMK